MYELFVSILALALSAPALADPIILNAPYPAGPVFTPLPGNMVEVSNTSIGSPAFYPGPIGSATSDAGVASVGVHDLIAGPGVNAIYPASGTGSLYYTANTNAVVGTHDSDTLQANIIWNQVWFVNDGTYYVGPRLYGIGTVTYSIGDIAFETDFPVGATFSIEADLISCARFGFACPAGQAQGTNFVGGTVTPVPSPPIGKGPAALLCVTILGLVNMYWRRAKNKAS